MFGIQEREKERRKIEREKNTIQTYYVSAQPGSNCLDVRLYMCLPGIRCDPAIESIGGQGVRLLRKEIGDWSATWTFTTGLMCLRTHLNTPFAHIQA